MRQQHIATIGLAGGMWATPACAAPAITAGEVAAHTASVIATAITSGYRAAPALMLGLAMLVAMPLVAVCMRVQAWRRQVRAARAHTPARRSGEAMQAPSEAHAFVEVLSPAAARVEILHDMLRIGREADNDIRLRSDTVHLYHAAIYRQDAGTYCIADFAGTAGDGVRVNGERCEEALLHDGDLIELGPGRLRFHAGLV